VKHGGSFFHAGYLRHGHRNLLLAHGPVELLGGEAMLGPALGQRRRDRSQACPLVVGDLDLKGCRPQDVDIRRDGDLRRNGFETWPQVVSTASHGGDSDQDEDDNDR